MADRSGGTKLGLLLVGFAALYGICIARRDFWYPDEPDLAAVTREMVASRQWLQMHLNGEDFADYPPLFFWLTSGAALLGGLHEVPMRLPTVLSALGLLAVTSAWARRRLGERAALWSTVVLGTTYFFVWQAVNMHLDMVFAFFFGAAVCSYDLSRDWATRQGRVGLLVTSTVAMGLASLTKGPAGIVLPGAILAFDHLAHREWRAWWRLALVGAGAVAVSAAWCVLYAAAEGQGNVAYFVYEQNVKRFLTGWSHSRPWYYYLRNLWLDLTPWALFLPFALAAAWRAARSGRRPVALALMWFGFGFVFFSISRSKRHVYLLPLYPAVAVMIGRLVAERLEAAVRGRWLWRVALWPPVAALVVAGASVPSMLSKVREELPTTPGLSYPLIALAAALLVGGVLLAVWLARGRPGKAVRGLPVVCAAVYLLGMGWLLPVLDTPLSAKEDARWLAQHAVRERGERLGFFSRNGDMPHESSALSFYGDFLIAVLYTKEEIAAYRASRPDAVLVVRDRHLKEIAARTGLEPVIVKPLQVGDDRLYAVRLKPRAG